MTWLLSDAHHMPYFDGQGNGYIEVLAQALASEGWRIDLVQLPRTRVESTMLTQQADLIAITNPNWVDDRSKMLFSDAYIHQPMAMVSLPMPPITSFDQLADKRVIEFAGYFYKEPYRSAERLSTVYIYRPEQGYRMLLADRADVLLLDSLILDYQRSVDHRLAPLIKHDLLVSSDSVHFGIASDHPERDLMLEAINRVIANNNMQDWMHQFDLPSN